MSITAHLKAIEADFDAIRGPLNIRDIETCLGRFDASEIARNSFKAPALRIAFLGAPKSQPKADGARHYDGAFAVFVLTDGRGRDLEGIDLMEAIAARIELNRFSSAPGTGIPKNLRLDALFTTQIDKKGVSLFSVSWTQTMQIGVPQGLGDASDPEAIPLSGVVLDTDIDITEMPDVETPEGIHNG